MRFSLNLLGYCILFTYSTQYEVLKIGGIFFQDELDLVESFDMAIQEINDLELDVRLEAVKHFLGDDDSVQIQLFACDFIENGVAAIFGPSSKASSNIIEVLCNVTGIPHLQFDFPSHGWSVDMRHNRRMTVNVAPSELLLSMALYDILRNEDFDWKSFTIVYEANSDLARMQHLLAWKNVHRSGIKIRQFARDDDYRTLWKYISSTKEKYVLLDCPPDILVDVVNASMLFNMTGQFNNLFLTNLDSHRGNIFQLYSKDFTASTMAMKIRTYQPALTHNELDVFEDADEEKLVSLRTQLLYDAVILFFTAARNIIKYQRFYQPEYNSCRRPRMWRSGVDIVEEMKQLTPKNTTIPFKTQKLHLNRYGERDDFNLEIYNPMTERISHVWNINHQLVSYDSLVENSTKKAQKRKLGDKEDFSQKRVRFTVSTRVGEPYFMWRPEPEGVHYEGNERFEGYAVDLIYKLAEECKFDFAFEPVPDNKYGSYDAVTDEWNGIIRELIDNNAQIGICDLTITQARRSVVDFTVPFMQLGVSILYYKPPPVATNLFAFLNPYAIEVWLYLIICLIIFSLLLVLNARLSQSEWLNPTPEKPSLSDEVENIWCLRNAFWLMIGSIMNSGCDLLPRGAAVRFYTAFWWIFALLVSQTYIAKLASFITFSKMDGSIRNFHDLVDQNKVQFGTIKGGSTSLFFSESNETEYRLAWNKMIAMKPEAFTGSNQEGVDRVKRSRGRYAFLMETTNLQYHVQRNCELAQVGEPFGEKHYGIAVPLNAPFRSNLSVGILKLSEKGELYKLKNKWFNSNTTECGLQNGGTDDSGQFGMEAVGGLFVVLIAGVILALLIGIGEFLMHVNKAAVKDAVLPMDVVKSELRFFACFWLRQKPLRTYQLSQTSTTTGYSSFDQSTRSASSKKRKRKKSLKT